MPEGVEVCLIALYLNERLSNQQLVNIEILGGRYKKKAFQGYSNIKNALPLTINCIKSKGKFLFFEFNNNTYLLNTFGLEGIWTYDNNKNNNNIKITINNNNNDNDNIYMYFNDSRNYGTLKYTENRNMLNDKLNELAPDLLKEKYNNSEFYDRIKKCNSKRGNKKKIVQVLMDQNNSGVGSGIGNYLVAEILYKSKLSPHITIGEIYQNRKICDELCFWIKYTMKLSYLTNVGGYFNKMDTQIIDWINNFRMLIKNNIDHIDNYHPDIDIGNDIFDYVVYKKKKDKLGNDVLPDKIIKDRTTWWIPSVQTRSIPPK